MGLQYDAFNNGPINKCVAVTPDGVQHAITQKALPGESLQYVTPCGLTTGATIQRGTANCTACAAAQAGG